MQERLEALYDRKYSVETHTDEAKGHYELIYIQFIESKITWPHQTKMFDEVFFWRMSDED